MLSNVSTITDADGRVDNPAAYAEGFEPAVSVRPLRLHTQQVEGPLGGHCFSADFAKYLSSVKPRLVTQWQLRCEYWWASPYGQMRVHRAFLRDLGADRGEQVYRIALICASNWRAQYQLIETSGFSAYRVRSFVSRANTYARRPPSAAVA